MDLMSKYILSEEKSQERMSICNACEHKIEITNMCGKCGCYLPWKVNLAPAMCPVLKWTSILTEVPPESTLPGAQ